MTKEEEEEEDCLGFVRTVSPLFNIGQFFFFFFFRCKLINYQPTVFFLSKVAKLNFVYFYPYRSIETMNVHLY